MNGYEAARIFRKDENLKKIPVIALTASVMKENEEKIRELCDAYLRKPVSKSNLIFEAMKFLPHTAIKKNQVSTQVEAEAIIPPPAEEMNALHELAMKVSMSKIIKHANSLEQQDIQYQPFADKLRKLVQGYQDEALIIFIKKYMECPNKP